MKSLKNFKAKAIKNPIRIKGGTEPVETSGTEIGKAKNRRVEFILQK